MASKVSLLGERLRGAQFEVSDLRGNIDHLLQDLEDGVFIFNRDSRLVFASGAVEKFLGRDRAGLPGQPLSSVFPPATLVGLLVAQAAADRVGHTQSPRARRGPGRAAAGPAVVLLSVDILETMPGANGKGSGMLVRLRDPEAKRKIDRELQMADRLTAISRISSGVAHEVKNPLNAILLHVEVARSKLSRGDTDVGEQMEIIAREILRLDRVVRTFLDFTRPVELQLETVPMQELVGEIVELAQPQTAAANIQVSAKLEIEGVDVRVDRDLLKQAVLNVVVNAMQAMPQGGELRFEACVARDTAELRISDSGPGIPRGAARQDFPALLHDQGKGLGNRAGHDLPDRATSRWYNRFHERTGKGYDLPDPPAYCGVNHEDQGTAHRPRRHRAGRVRTARQAESGGPGGAQARGRSHSGSRAAAPAAAIHSADPCGAAPRSSRWTRPRWLRFRSPPRSPRLPPPRRCAALARRRRAPAPPAAAAPAAPEPREAVQEIISAGELKRLQERAQAHRGEASADSGAPEPPSADGHAAGHRGQHTQLHRPQRAGRKLQRHAAGGRACRTRPDSRQGTTEWKITPYAQRRRAVAAGLRRPQARLPAGCVRSQSALPLGLHRQQRDCC